MNNQNQNATPTYPTLEHVVQPLVVEDRRVPENGVSEPRDPGPDPLAEERMPGRFLEHRDELPDPAARQIRILAGRQRRLLAR